MRFWKRHFVLAVVTLVGSPLLISQVAVAGTITITKCKMTDKTSSTEVTSGYADAALSVEFKGEATCNCECPNLTYTWYFGDGDSAGGATTSHAYSGSKAGNRSPYLNVHCNSCSADKNSSSLSVAAINGINVTTVGNSLRLCFDAVRNVAASALPSGVSGSNKIDWHLAVGTADVNLANSSSGTLPSPSPWPTNNSSWGSHTLYVSIDGPHVPGQQGELNLTGTASYVDNDQSINVFYDATESQNPTSAPNWFYYYKDNQGGTGYSYEDTGTSHSDPGGGMSSVHIGNDVYNGSVSLLYDYGNPGGRLRATGTTGTHKYYLNFLAIVAHETQHATNEVATGGEDGDGGNDYLTAAFETGTSKTDPSDTWSAINGVAYTPDDDGEVYAAGPIEGAAISGADTSHDYAHAGTNWNP